MSTHALYTFNGSESYPGSFNVYKHSDGYPSGAVETLQTAIDYFAWRLPRYEVDAFASAFIAAGQSPWLCNHDAVSDYGPRGIYREGIGGEVRLMPQGNPSEVAMRYCADVEYRYEIAMIEKKLCIRALGVSYCGSKPIEDELFTGTFEGFKVFTTTVGRDR